MLKSLEAIRNQDFESYPIRCLYQTKEKNYNLEHLKSLKELNNKLVLNYIIRNLEILDSKNLKDGKIRQIIEEVLLWSDVSKTGSVLDRRLWKRKHYNLAVHNIGSSEIYKEYTENYHEIVYELIRTHGLIGQYIRGEVNLLENKDIYQLREKNLVTKEELRQILSILNECIIGAVSEKLYQDVKEEVFLLIERILDNQMDEPIDVLERMVKLNGKITDDERKVLEKILDSEKKEALFQLFSHTEVWYYQAAIQDFNIENQVKILLICSYYLKKEKYLSFEKLMKELYFDYKNVKSVNLYKKRIIESYLNSFSFQDIMNGHFLYNPHIKFVVFRRDDWATFSFQFSKVSKKLIDFCEVAYVSDSLYRKSVFLLYDLFGFRRDSYDRFYNEMDYLQTMNSTIYHKAKILEFMVGSRVLDVGPGGGALMDFILDNYSGVEVYGIDISANVIEALNKKMIEQNRTYHLIKGNALTLEEYLQPGEIDTIIYSSIIHELFSYIEYHGKKFQYEVIRKALQSAYHILPVGGRIIIRDGIMTEPKDTYRVIKFQNQEDIQILDRYCKDFPGRKISYQRINQNTVKMLVNDAMEFLYTYTWGEQSYPHEVLEQFGYFSPSEYERFVKENLPNSKIIYSNAFLQEGYSENLLPKVSIYDEDMKVVALPNSTYILVIEKEA